ncbi:hypothetical protein Tco_1445661 [Tanacetum coccineum]
MANYRYWLLIASRGWPFVSVVLGQMAYLVASITLDSARFCVMQGAFLTQGTVSSIPTILSWSGSISPEGFLSSVLLWLVIIVVIVGVGVTVVVVIVETFAIWLWLPTYMFEVGSAVKYFITILRCDLVGLFYSNSPFKLANEANCSFYTIEVERLTYEIFIVSLSCYRSFSWSGGIISFAMLAACASRAAETLSATSFLMAA